MTKTRTEPCSNKLLPVYPNSGSVAVNRTDGWVDAIRESYHIDLTGRLLGRQQTRQNWPRIYTSANSITGKGNKGGGLSENDTRHSR